MAQQATCLSIPYRPPGSLHYYTEYRALARVHWRAEILETDIGQGGGTM